MKHHVVGRRIGNAHTGRWPQGALELPGELVVPGAADGVRQVDENGVVLEVEERLHRERIGDGFRLGRRAGQLAIDLVNRPDWTKLSGRRALRVVATHDVLRAAVRAVAARDDAAGEQRAREVDGLVAIGAEQLEPRLINGGGCLDTPTHDRKVLLRAINQLDILWGEGRRQEMNVAAANDSGRQQRHPRQAAMAAGLLCGRLRSKHGERIDSAPRRQDRSKNHAYRYCRGGAPRRAVLSRLSLNFVKL